MVRPGAHRRPGGRPRHLHHRARPRDRPRHGGRARGHARGALRHDRSCPAARGRAHRHRRGPRARRGARAPRRRVHAGLPSPRERVRPGHEARGRGVPLRRREGRLLLRRRGARGLPPARARPLARVPRAHRHAPDRRARGGRHRGRLRPLRPGALLPPLRHGLRPGVHPHGQGAGPSAQLHQDLRRVRPPHVLPALRVRGLPRLQEPRAQAQRRDRHPARQGQDHRVRHAQGAAVPAPGERQADPRGPRRHDCLRGRAQEERGAGLPVPPGHRDARGPRPSGVPGRPDGPRRARPQERRARGARGRRLRHLRRAQAQASSRVGRLAGGREGRARRGRFRAVRRRGLRRHAPSPQAPPG